MAKILIVEDKSVIKSEIDLGCKTEWLAGNRKTDSMHCFSGAQAGVVSNREEK